MLIFNTKMGYCCPISEKKWTELYKNVAGMFIVSNLSMLSFT